ncbi:hypothetical protein [Rhodoplanes sp. Z2-YC6860]|uniref:hypothetical protein n=1 Tax=Rhodoplanes sp. Z2-YC6860 TaxID=674703 RepID=UPI000834AD28|nr:hypothetical protein [Rhodoplanes sp. Z2-YC6860]
MTVQAFLAKYPNGKYGWTGSLMEQEQKLKRQAVLTAVNFNGNKEGFFTYKGEGYFWQVTQTLDHEPCLLIGPMEDYF